jgi:hypothetical protein
MSTMDLTLRICYYKPLEATGSFILSMQVVKSLLRYDQAHGLLNRSVFRVVDNYSLCFGRGRLLVCFVRSKIRTTLSRKLVKGLMVLRGNRSRDHGAVPKAVYSN